MPTPDPSTAPDLSTALAAFDDANARDPNRVAVDGGGDAPAELLYGRRMSARLRAYLPDASDALRLAARAQHLERWTIPRDDYPMDRAGYHAWRNDLKRYHARRAGDLLRGLGFGEGLIERVGFLLEKKALKRDDETQALEDVICLVFLEHYAGAFAAKHETPQVVSILAKTLGKMSARGRAAAAELDLAPGVRALFERALAARAPEADGGGRA